MTTEDESWRKQFASEGNGGGDRPHRPSFNRNGGGYQRERREFRSNDGYNREGGYRQREGGYQRENRDSRPGGDYNRGGYRQREGGYQGRPYSREGGYQRREGGYQHREGGYQSRPGGYKKRPQGYNPHAKYSMKKQIEYKEKNYDPDEPVRLNRYLANAGVCSRREADTFIQAGVVKVNGVVVTELGT
ncbi:MAG: pseudouridine synthase, partial [Bacteroidaceae bacterium]|nr:pseudouridine synthase [Bacteroidaceae bacterium]